MKNKPKQTQFFGFYIVNVGNIDNMGKHLEFISVLLLNAIEGITEWSWERFTEYLEHYPLPRPHIMHKFY